jgi:hypothetical protein
MSVSEKCLEKIKEQNIRPTSRYVFWFKELLLKIFLPILALLSVIFFTISVSSVIETEMDIFAKYGMNFWEYVFDSIPFLAIFLCIFSFFIATYLYKKTTFGYKLPNLNLIIFGVMILICGTTIMFITKISNAIDHAVEATPEISQLFRHHKFKIWNAPEKGLLAGKVSRNIENETLEIIDLSKQGWVVNIDKIPKHKKLMIQQGAFVKFVGSKESDFVFYAVDAKPW